MKFVIGIKDKEPGCEFYRLNRKQIKEFKLLDSYAMVANYVCNLGKLTKISNTSEVKLYIDPTEEGPISVLHQLVEKLLLDNN